MVVIWGACGFITHGDYCRLDAQREKLFFVRGVLRRLEGGGWEVGSLGTGSAVMK